MPIEHVSEQLQGVEKRRAVPRGGGQGCGVLRGRHGVDDSDGTAILLPFVVVVDILTPDSDKPGSSQMASTA